jgi:hypothetical protein
LKLTSTAIIGSLRSGETAFRPSKGGAVHVEEGVFLLETEPGLEVQGSIKDLLGVIAVVGPVRGTIVVIGLSHDKDVVSASEGVLEDGSGAKVDIRVVTGSLVGGGAIEVPDAEILNLGDLLVDSLSLTC